MRQSLIDKVDAVRSVLEARYNDYQENVVREEHWIDGGGQFVEPSDSYCYECAKKKVAEYQKTDDACSALTDTDELWDMYHVDGGWGWHESESQHFCETCSVTLLNSPLDEFIKWEVIRYDDFDIGEVDNQVAYELYLLLDNIADQCDDWSESKCEDERDLCLICTKVINKVYKKLCLRK